MRVFEMVLTVEVDEKIADYEVTESSVEKAIYKALETMVELDGVGIHKLTEIKSLPKIPPESGPLIH